MLLAYYIAAVNIETTYHALMGKTAGSDAYEPFTGMALADTFQISEASDVEELAGFLVLHGLIRAADRRGTARRR